MSPRINIEITSDRNCARSRSDVVTLPASKVAGSCHHAAPQSLIQRWKSTEEGGGGYYHYPLIFTSLNRVSRLVELLSSTISIRRKQQKDSDFPWSSGLKEKFQLPPRDPAHSIDFLSTPDQEFTSRGLCLFIRKNFQKSSRIKHPSCCPLIECKETINIKFSPIFLFYPPVVQNRYVLYYALVMQKQV